MNRDSVMPNLSEKLDGGFEMILEGDESQAEDNEQPEEDVVKQENEFKEEQKQPEEASVTPGPTPGDTDDSAALIAQLGPFVNNQ